MSQKRALRNGTTPVYIDMWVDGGPSASLGSTSVGVMLAVEVNDELIGVHSFAKTITTEVTKEEAEYEAFLEGMKRLKEILIEYGFNPDKLAGTSIVLVNFFINSAIVFNQLRGDWALKEEKLKALYHRAREAFDEYKHHESIHVALYKGAAHEVRFASHASSVCMEKVKVLI